MVLKPQARVIVPAWGQKYIDLLTCYALPSLLAPGNLPALAKDFHCAVVLVVEERMFEAVRRSRIWRPLQALCDVELRPVDDLVVPSHHYGVSLTYALFRGFEELGAAMTDHHLIFGCADWIVADGSLRTLGERMRAGERQIHAPSYCVMGPPVMPVLAARTDQRTGALTIAPRDMARLILDQRHLTIRAKTVNQTAFRMHRYDQFYWDAGDHALLARQLPIALVAMRPERASTTMQTFWDYGVVSEFFETPRPCVLGDSDDFLMLELREPDAFANLFRFGRASIDEIASDLSTFTTQDQRNHAGYTLIVHDEDVPPAVEEDRRELDRFVSQVVERLSPPVDYRNHVFWRDGTAGFEERRAEFLEAGGAKNESPALPAEAARPPAGLIGRLYAGVFGRLPFVRTTHPYHLMVQETYRVLERELAKPRRRVLVLSGGDSRTLAAFVRTRTAGDAAIVERKSWETTSRSGADDGTTREDGGDPFDLCVCELDLEGLLRLDDIWRAVREGMAPDGRLVALYLNHAGADLRSLQHALIRSLPVGQCRVSFAGSRVSRWGLTLFRRAASLGSQGGALQRLAGAGAMLMALPLIVVGNLRSRPVSEGAMPRDCLSITIEYRRR